MVVRGGDEGLMHSSSYVYFSVKTKPNSFETKLESEVKVNPRLILCVSYQQDDSISPESIPLCACS